MFLSSSRTIFFRSTTKTSITAKSTTTKEGAQTGAAAVARLGSWTGARACTNKSRADSTVISAICLKGKWYPYSWLFVSSATSEGQQERQHQHQEQQRRRRRQQQERQQHRHPTSPNVYLLLLLGKMPNEWKFLRLYIWLICFKCLHVLYGCAQLPILFKWKTLFFLKFSR